MKQTITEYKAIYSLCLSNVKSTWDIPINLYLFSFSGLIILVDSEVEYSIRTSRVYFPNIDRTTLVYEPTSCHVGYINTSGIISIKTDRLYNQIETLYSSMWQYITVVRAFLDKEGIQYP